MLKLLGISAELYYYFKWRILSIFRLSYWETWKHHIPELTLKFSFASSTSPKALQKDKTKSTGPFQQIESIQNSVPATDSATTPIPVAKALGRQQIPFMVKPLIDSVHQRPHGSSWESKTLGLEEVGGGWRRVENTIKLENISNPYTKQESGGSIVYT